eukprot:TRINITY_DN7460_c0_g1_i2.p1 TRINITY_DN7460_c0_g1~~TRINITY_DN7460_c0_g1_i2.p1  ORF type:complete len:175 (-),score=20.00 TRINITY_DN7460_c0_g1_i2:270-794(-)
MCFIFFFFKQKTAYEIMPSLVGSEMCIRDSINAEYMGLFQQLANKLTMHLQKEEMVLFPYIKKLVTSEVSGNCDNDACFGSIASPISVMEQEHETAGIILKQLDKLSNGYTAPEDACNTFRVLYGKLKAFEDDLHVHIHLENNILFPKAIELEQTLVAGQQSHKRVILQGNFKS